MVASLNGGCAEDEPGRAPPASAAPAAQSSTAHGSAAHGSAAHGNAARRSPARGDEAAASVRSGAGCRVISLRGEASADDGRRLAAGQLLRAPRWVELASGARLHFKHAESGREWVAEGPARLVPCAYGEEEIVIAQGQLRLEGGAGVRPGASVLVGTPFGALRYGDARGRVSVGSELSVEVQAGELSFVPVSGDEAAERLPVRAAGFRRTKRLDADVALQGCARAAAAARGRAEDVLGANAGATLGERAAAHVRLRRHARASCASAAAAVLQQLAGERRAAGLKALDEHRAAWRSVPGSRT